MEILIYDCEILRAIPPKEESARIENIEYCQGWHDHINMGISVICAYDYLQDRYRVFCKDNFSQFQELLNSRKYLIGFNHIHFDNQLITKNGFTIPRLIKHYDLLQEIWRSAGLSPDFDSSTHLGYGLDACAEVNFDLHKSGNGATAPVEWQRGKIGNVVDYCLNDVYLTKRLFDQVLAGFSIRDPKDKYKYLELRSLFAI
jgi:hypothetical protein